MEDLAQSAMLKHAMLSGNPQSGTGNTGSRHSPTSPPTQDSLHSGWPPGAYQGHRPTSVPVSGVFQPPPIPDSLMTDTLMNQYGDLLRSGRNSSIEEPSAIPQPPPQHPMHFQEYETLSTIEASMQGCYQGLLAQRRLNDFEFCERGRQNWDSTDRNNDGGSFQFSSGNESTDNGNNAANPSIANDSRNQEYCQTLGKNLKFKLSIIWRVLMILIFYNLLDEKSVNNLPMSNSYFSQNGIIPSQYSESNNSSSEERNKSYLIDVGQTTGNSCSRVHHTLSPLPKKAQISRPNGLQA